MVDGTLLWIPNYEFQNGQVKDKFFLLIREIDGQQLVVSLPSSVDHMPTATPIVHGCIELEKANQTTYCFTEGTVVASDTSFCFSKNTFLYGCWLNDVSKLAFFQKYPVENLHYVVKGVLDKAELDNIIKCFVNSCEVKRKYKRLLL